MAPRVRRWIAPLLFAGLFLGLALRRPHFVPAELEIAGEIDRPLRARLDWSSGTGWNAFESKEVLLATDAALRVRRHRLVVERLGVRNPASQNGEVWITALETRVGRERRPVDLTTLAVPAGSVRDLGRNCLTADLAALEYEGEFEGLHLVLVRHPFSGTARVTVDGIEQGVVDLYATEADAGPLKMAISAPPDAAAGPGPFARVTALPQSRIRAIALESLEPGRTLPVATMSIESARGSLGLAIPSGGPSSRLVFDGLPPVNRAWSPILLSVQAALALLLTWAALAVAGLRARIGCATWGETLRCICVDRAALGLLGDVRHEHPRLLALATRLVAGPHDARLARHLARHEEPRLPQLEPVRPCALRARAHPALRLARGHRDRAAPGDGGARQRDSLLRPRARRALSVDRALLPGLCALGAGGRLQSPRLEGRALLPPHRLLGVLPLCPRVSPTRGPSARARPHRHGGAGGVARRRRDDPPQRAPVPRRDSGHDAPGRASPAAPAGGAGGAHSGALRRAPVRRRDRDRGPREHELPDHRPQRGAEPVGRAAERSRRLLLGRPRGRPAHPRRAHRSRHPGADLQPALRRAARPRRQPTRRDRRTRRERSPAALSGGQPRTSTS